MHGVYFMTSGHNVGQTDLARLCPDAFSPARNHELITIGVFELGEGSPNFGLRPLRKLDPVRCQLPGGGEYIVAPESQGLKGADSILMAWRREEREPGIRARNQKLDPPLAVPHGLIGPDFETEFLGVKLQRGILVANRNAGDLDSSYHVSLLR
jgi:hypothetical protein